MSINTIVALLLFLTISEGVLGDHGVNQRCRCISKEKRPIRRYIGKVEVHLPSSHCQDIEIIATLKKDGQKICLDPDAPWVKNVLQRKQAQRRKP
ncbi:C-X-C motif chemokine 10-like [Etheostoma cragini]|uniref:C-X-C motif chemokine 10-like n=1 Tax=Etheostoma cragini TaxID=417921 RepID=UPI00155DFAF0|nr:C-X-C motif chemokine 10-like [Etheostoma cragini]